MKKFCKKYVYESEAFKYWKDFIASSLQILTKYCECFSAWCEIIGVNYYSFFIFVMKKMFCLKKGNVKW